MQLNTSASVISFAKQLEADSAAFYERMAERHPKAKEVVLTFSKENSNYATMIQRAYYGVITDAIEGCFAFSVETDKYAFRKEPAKEAGLSDALNQAIDMEQKAHLFHPGQYGEFLGQDLVQAGGIEEQRKVFVYVSPVLADLLVNVHLLNPEILLDLDRSSPVLVQKASFKIKYVGQAVGRVQGHDNGPVTAFGRPDAGGGRHARLAHASLSGEKYYPQQRLPPVVRAHDGLSSAGPRAALHSLP